MVTVQKLLLQAVLAIWRYSRSVCDHYLAKDLHFRVNLRSALPVLDINIPKMPLNLSILISLRSISSLSGSSFSCVYTHSVEQLDQVLGSGDGEDTTADPGDSFADVF